MYASLNHELMKEKSQLIDPTLFSKILRNKYNLGYLDHWIYYTFKKVSEKPRLYNFKFCSIRSICKSSLSVTLYVKASQTQVPGFRKRSIQVGSNLSVAF